jgi:hypothetical protein
MESKIITLLQEEYNLTKEEALQYYDIMCEQCPEILYKIAYVYL